METRNKKFYVVYLENSVMPMPFIKYETIEEAQKEAERVQYGTGRNVWVLEAKMCVRQPEKFDKVIYE